MSLCFCDLEKKKPADQENNSPSKSKGYVHSKEHPLHIYAKNYRSGSSSQVPGNLRLQRHASQSSTPRGSVVGQDFSQVPVHSNTETSWSEIKTFNYINGMNVASESPSYNSSIHNGAHLISPEFNHPSDQNRSSGQRNPRQIDPEPSAEEEAQRAANDIIYTGEKLKFSTSKTFALMRFGGREHVEIGNRALPGRNVLIMGYGDVSFGEMIAMADYFESLQQMQDIVAREGQFGREQIDLVRWKVNPNRTRPEYRRWRRASS